MIAENVRNPSGDLHAGVATKANERAKLERLCRYITRPAISTKRLSMTRNGRVRYELKTPWRNGTTHVIFEPLDFISRLVALVPRPRVNLTRFHGVFAPNSKYRARVTAQPGVVLSTALAANSALTSCASFSLSSDDSAALRKVRTPTDLSQS